MENFEGETVVVGELADVGILARVIDAHRDHMQSLRTERLVQRFDAGHFRAARTAPRRPDIQQHHFAFVVRERLRSRWRVERGAGEHRGRASDINTDQLVLELIRSEPERAAKYGDDCTDDTELLA